MARARNPRGSSLTGIGVWLGRIAQFFRFGTAGAAVPGTAAPARTTLHSVEEAIDVARLERVLPTAEQGRKVAYSIVCYWVDPQTGDRIGDGVKHVVEADPGATYQALTAEGRRRTLYGPGAAAYVQKFLAMGARLRCTMIGSAVEIPTQT